MTAKLYYIGDDPKTKDVLCPKQAIIDSLTIELHEIKSRKITFDFEAKARLYDVQSIEDEIKRIKASIQPNVVVTDTDKGDYIPCPGFPVNINDFLTYCDNETDCLLTDKFSILEHCHVYSFWYKSTPLYFGIGQDIVARAESHIRYVKDQHIGNYWLGETIMANSDKWADFILIFFYNIQHNERSPSKRKNRHRFFESKLINSVGSIFNATHKLKHTPRHEWPNELINPRKDSEVK